MPDLRKIVDRLSMEHNEPGQRSKDIAALIDALVEERAKVLCLDDESNNRIWEYTPDKIGDVIGPAKEKYRTQAKAELNIPDWRKDGARTES